MKAQKGKISALRSMKIKYKIYVNVYVVYKRVYIQYPYTHTNICMQHTSCTACILTVQVYIHICTCLPTYGIYTFNGLF